MFHQSKVCAELYDNPFEILKLNLNCIYKQ